MVSESMSEVVKYPDWRISCVHCQPPPVSAVQVGVIPSWGSVAVVAALAAVWKRHCGINYCTRGGLMPSISF